MLRLMLVVLLLAGCFGSSASAVPVPLLTGEVPMLVGANGEQGCFTDFAVGLLAVDPKYGTEITDESTGTSYTVPVMWRPGFSGRWVGSQIEVLDPDGKVVATTGGRYKIAGGYWSENPRVFFACDFVISQ